MLLDQGAAIAGIHEELALLREFFMGRQSQLPPQAPLLVPTQAALPAPSWTTSDAASVSDDVPIHRVPFPHSSSPLPPWHSGTPPEPVFSPPPPRAALPCCLGRPTLRRGGSRGIFYILTHFNLKFKK
jgi:hypothetical protein